MRRGMSRSFFLRRLRSWRIGAMRHIVQPAILGSGVVHVRRVDVAVDRLDQAEDPEGEQPGGDEGEHDESSDEGIDQDGRVI